MKKRPTLPRYPDVFTAWLQTHAPTEVVGQRSSYYRCPLAHYLQCRGATSADVDTSDYATDGHAKRATPRWARVFLTALDARGSAGSSVMAGEALQVLALQTKPACKHNEGAQRS
jgi:hypothetical protein